MSIYHDEDSSNKDMIRDISDKHCPDSIRKSAYEELKKRGLSKRDAQAIADKRHGDYYG